MKKLILLAIIACSLVSCTSGGGESSLVKRKLRCINDGFQDTKIQFIDTMYSVGDTIGYGSISVGYTRWVIIK